MAKKSAAEGSLTPLFKWTGGKRRELVKFSPHYPTFVKTGGGYRFVEPFVGAGAVYFSLNNPNSHINDWDADLVNFYKVMATADPKFLTAVTNVSKLFSDTSKYDLQSAAYYKWRALDVKPGLAKLPDWKRAARFFIINQLAFSGMRRFSSTGVFNVPFGHYKSFNSAALKSKEHRSLLAASTISQGDYAAVLDVEDNPNTFIFIDPPYTRVMKTYSSGNEFGDKEQLILRDKLVAMKDAKWMVVIDESELTLKLYDGWIVDSYPVNYGVNIKNRFSQAARHIVACNYTTASGVTPKALI